MTSARAQWFPATAYAAVLLTLNFYICRNLLWTPLTFTNSMHGFWMAIAERAQGSWLHPSWWPFWDCGIPFEFTYAPLLPASMAGLSHVLGIAPDRAFQIITAVVYCLGPVTLFLAAFLFTRSATGSFLAALIYSLTSPSQLLVPDGDPRVSSVWAARRLALMVVWDDTPHMLALLLLPLAVVALYLALTRTHACYRIAAIALAALMIYSSVFAIVLMALVSLALLAVISPRELLPRARTILFIGGFSYALAAAFLPPSLLRTIRNAAAVEAQDAREIWLGLLVAAAALTLFWHYVKRWTPDTTLRFLALLAFIVCVVPLADFHLHHQLLPQPGRYKLEMDAVLPMLVVFSLRGWFQRLPLGVRGALLLAVLALAANQIARYHSEADYIFRPASLDQTVEARASRWAAQNLPDVRLMLPGSLAMWADAFAPVPQLSGSSWSIAYNQVLQRGKLAQTGAADSAEQDAKICLAWLKAFGVGAVGVSGPQSAEFWKGYQHPAKFDGVLPVLWQSEGVTIYRLPLFHPSLAHVIPKSAIVRKSPLHPADIAPMEPYLEALDDSGLPPAPLTWEGRNRIHVRATASPSQAVSLQVTFHKGWHATVNGRRIRVQRDALNLIWLDPGCNGACDIALDYDGGWELRLVRYLSVIAFVALLAWAAKELWWRGLQPAAPA
jgi:hypothetical protein